MTKSFTGSSGRLLSRWQKKQAAMLCYFSSEDYLKVLHKMVSELIQGFVDPLLEMAKAQKRDRILVNKIWGNRYTSQNWANNAWPVLKDLQASLARSIALRGANRYRITAVNECLRGINEYSVDWATPGEQRILHLALQTISEYAGRYDKTVEEYENRWTDFIFAYHYPAFEALNRGIPKFAVREDVVGETGSVPPRTGVYLSADEPHAGLQFVSAENGGAELRVANTFNEVGVAALLAVGREALWIDEVKMLNFATSKPYAAQFHDSVFLDGEPYPSLAPAAVARSAFKTSSCKWLLVEIVPGEFEELASLVEPGSTAIIAAQRIVGGDLCPEAGFYFTPSASNSRRFFRKGEMVPRIDSAYGATYWQWDSDQST